jgi:hypothetical protein
LREEFNLKFESLIQAQRNAEINYKPVLTTLRELLPIVPAAVPFYGEQEEGEEDENDLDEEKVIMDLVYNSELTGDLLKDHVRLVVSGFKDLGKLKEVTGNIYKNIGQDSDRLEDYCFKMFCSVYETFSDDFDYLNNKEGLNYLEKSLKQALNSMK